MAKFDFSDDSVVVIIGSGAGGGTLANELAPLSVLVSMTPLRMPWRHQAFLSWAGLRGAVPIVLATIPLSEGVPGAEDIFDIVFVMDVSTSMSGVLQKLEEEILTVDAKLKTLNVLPDVHYGLVVFVDDAQIIDAGAPYVDVQDLKKDFNYYWMFTQYNSQVSGGGSNVDFPENTIDALYIAAGGFQWRPVEDTLRMVIHTTDDTFGEKGAVQSMIEIQHTYDETVAALQAQQVRVFSFADNDMTGGPVNNEDVSMGFFTPYNGKTPIPEATDGGAFNINLVNKNQLSLSAAINDSVEQSLCEQYIPL